RGQATWEEAEAAASTLDLGLKVLEDRLAQAREALAAASDEGVATDVARWQVNRRLEALAKTRETIRRAVLRADRDEIAWVTRSDGDVRVGRAPLDVSSHLAESIYGGRESVLATSATLS